jgi:hypothetical protein
VSNSSGNPFIPFTQNPNKDKSTYKIPKKTENLYSRHDSDPEVDYDDDVNDDFIESIFSSVIYAITLFVDPYEISISVGSAKVADGWIASRLHDPDRGGIILHPSKLGLPFKE